MTLPVRPARPADGPRLRALQQLLAEPSPELLSTALSALSTESLAVTAAGGWRVVVSPDCDDEPVGYLLAITSTTTHIAELAVDPEFRRENRARTLLAAICESASRPVTVCVAAENTAARSLYEGYGFFEVDRTPEQFDSGTGSTLQYEPS